MRREPDPRVAAGPAQRNVEGQEAGGARGADAGTDTGVQTKRQAESCFRSGYSNLFGRINRINSVSQA